jgi:hypothetical protein
LRLVTPLASAKGWHQRQIQRFAAARRKIILKKILRQCFHYDCIKTQKKIRQTGAKLTAWEKIAVIAIHG